MTTPTTNAPHGDWCYCSQCIANPKPATDQLMARRSEAACSAGEFRAALKYAVKYLGDQADRFERMRDAMDEKGKPRLVTKYHNQAVALRMAIKPLADSILPNANVDASADEKTPTKKSNV